MINQFTRRQLIQGMAALGASGLIPNQVFSQGMSTLVKRPIPGTNEMLPVIGFGSSAPVRDILTDGPSVVESLIETMVNMGGSVVDTAPREYEIDEAFGKILADPRFKDKLFVSTKVGLNRFMSVREVDKAGGIKQFEQTNQLFNRHPADLVYVESMTDMDIHWPTLKDYKDKGEARYIGITSSFTEDHERMAAFMKKEKPDFIQVNFSLLEPQAENVVLPLARDMGIGVMINSPFNGGELFRVVRGKPLPDWAVEIDCKTWAQFNLKYILGVTNINTVLTETDKTYHLEDNIGGGMGRIPDDGMRRKMKAHFDSLG
jgi:diketogulonate reductase-like aldo/keto reductase